MLTHARVHRHDQHAVPVLAAQQLGVESDQRWPVLGLHHAQHVVDAWLGVAAALLLAWCGANRARAMHASACRSTHSGLAELDSPARQFPVPDLRGGAAVAGGGSAVTGSFWWDLFTDTPHRRRGVPQGVVGAAEVDERQTRWDRSEAPRKFPLSAHRGSAVDDKDLSRQCFRTVGG